MLLPHKVIKTNSVESGVLKISNASSPQHKIFDIRGNSDSTFKSCYIIAMAVPTDPDLAIETILPLRGAVVTLEFLKESNPQFFHQAQLTAFLRFLAGSPDDYDLYIRIDAPESGRIHYGPGGLYRFLLVSLNGGEGILEQLFIGFKGLPRSAQKTDDRLPFRENWRLYSIQDAFNEHAVNDASELSAYGIETLQEEVELWRHHQDIHWRWSSPARLLLAKDIREKLKGEARYCRNSDDLTFDLLLSRVYDGFSDLLCRRKVETASRGAPPSGYMENVHLFWMDTQYTDIKDAIKPMGGITGKFDLTLAESFSSSWWQLLVLGQYTGIGQRTTFGLGRYQLGTKDNAVSYRRPLPITSILTQAQDEENLDTAWRHVMSHGDAPTDLDDAWTLWEDDDGEEDSPEAPYERLQNDLDKLLVGKYQVPELRGHLIPKRDGGVRPLAISPIYDRVLQRAVAQVLTPALEQLMYRHSHGYRPGRSRITAHYDIQAAWRAGYRWAYESDIRDFFDSVDLQRLQDRLTAIYGDDPVIQAVLGWMRAAV